MHFIIYVFLGAAGVIFTFLLVLGYQMFWGNGSGSDGGSGGRNEQFSSTNSTVDIENVPITDHNATANTSTCSM